MRSLSIPALLMSAIVFVSLPAAGQQAMGEEDESAAIIVRCHYEMGEFGVEGVQVCIETENAARAALKAYPASVQEIVLHCRQQMSGAGWGHVKRCVDEQLAAGRPTRE